MTTKIEAPKFRKLKANEMKARRFSLGRFLLWLEYGGCLSEGQDQQQHRQKTAR